MLKQLVIKWLTPLVKDLVTAEANELAKRDKAILRDEANNYLQWLFSKDNLSEFTMYGSNTTIRGRMQAGIVKQVSAEVDALIKQAVEKLSHDPQHLKEVVDTIRKLQIQ